MWISVFSVGKINRLPMNDTWTSNEGGDYIALILRISKLSILVQGLLQRHSTSFKDIDVKETPRRMKAKSETQMISDDEIILSKLATHNTLPWSNLPNFTRFDLVTLYKSSKWKNMFTAENFKAKEAER